MPVNPIVATLDVYTTRRTPFFRAASRIARVPSTFDRYISSRIAHPEPVVGRHVKNGIAARHGFFERSGIAQIAGSSLGLESFQISQIARRTHQQPQLRALIGKNAGDVGT